MYQVYGGEGGGKKGPPPLLVFFVFFFPGESKIRGRKMYFFNGRSPRGKIHYLELGDGIIYIYICMY